MQHVFRWDKEASQRADVVMIGITRFDTLSFILESAWPVAAKSRDCMGTGEGVLASLMAIISLFTLVFVPFRCPLGRSTGPYFR